MASITFPYAASGVTFLAQTFDALNGGTAWTPADSMVGSGIQKEVAGNHGNAIGMLPDGTSSPFDLSTLGSAAGTITSAIVSFDHNGTYSTVGPGSLYDLTAFGETHTQADGASWSSAGTFDATAFFTGGLPGEDLIENLPTFTTWYGVAAAFGSVENGVVVGYQITALSIEFTYTGSATPVVTDVSPSHGDAAGGTVVTLTGTDLDLGTNAFFNGTPASGYSASSATSATCVTPEHAVGPVTVTVV